jgi:hypothetical protein
VSFYRSFDEGDSAYINCFERGSPTVAEQDMYIKPATEICSFEFQFKLGN